MTCKRDPKSKSRPGMKLAPVRVFSCRHPLISSHLLISRHPVQKSNFGACAVTGYCSFKARTHYVKVRSVCPEGHFYCPHSARRQCVTFRAKVPSSILAIGLYFRLFFLFFFKLKNFIVGFQVTSLKFKLQNYRSY